MHFLHISCACRAHLANTHFFVDFSTKNSARMGIDGHNQRFYNMVVNMFYTLVFAVNDLKSVIWMIRPCNGHFVKSFLLPSVNGTSAHNFFVKPIGKP